MPKTEEYKDKRGENRIRITADNGKVIYGSTEGYKNLQDMRTVAVTAALEILENYLPMMTPEQGSKLRGLGDVSKLK